MGVLDLSSNKCHPLELPNVDNKNSRLRLDCRTGASVDILNSRIFVYGGSTLKLDIPASFTLDIILELYSAAVEKNCNSDKNIDYNQFLSTECFRLSLINKKWIHYSVNRSTNPEIPPARMFQSMCIYDNYLFISGGIKFDQNNQPEILNDLWQFDIIDKQWKCIYENGNDVLLKRYDHIMIMMPHLEAFDKSYIHPGIAIIGGLDEQNEYRQSIDLFDITLRKCHDRVLTGLEELKTSKQEDSQLIPIKIRNSLNAIHSMMCTIAGELKLFVFSKSPNEDEYEPLIFFNEDSKGVRCLHSNSFQINSISNMTYPILGQFGENLIIVGFSANEKKISSYLFNVRTETWTRLQISCIHKIYSHKFSKGFVWESHHKIAYLGSMKPDDVGGAVCYFDNLVIMSLPFTNFFGKKSNIFSKSRTSTSASLQSSKSFDAASNKRGNSITSSNSSVKNFFHHNHQQQQQQQQEHTGDFAGYAFHIAQQMQVNSIRSVLPAYAIAIGKNAFDRSDALSDMDFICSDGSVVSVPITLCRRRWGLGFDELLADAYAKSYVEESASDMLLSESGCSSCDSYDTDECSSFYSKNSGRRDSTPYFRYPFQEKNNSRNEFSPIRRGDRMGSISANTSRFTSRHNSVSGSLLPTNAVNRTSTTMSQSRRHSSIIFPSRENSFNYISPSRRSSLSSAALSRRNSLSAVQIQQQSQSRRGSTFSRTSLLSTSANSINSANSTPIPRHVMNLQQQQNNPIGMTASTSNLQSPQAPTQGEIPHRSKSISSAYNLNTDMNTAKFNTTREEHITTQPDSININFDNLPNALPMPDVFPDGTPMNLDNDVSSQTLLPNLLTEEPFSQPMKSSSSTFSRNDLIKTFEHSDISIDPNVKFNPSRIPRALYLPYPQSVAHAIIEYLYSGQIGANWKLFPTGIEVLQATKQLSIPLLYDLILELFFVVLGVIEASLRDKLIIYLEERQVNTKGSNDYIYGILDTREVDDSDLDWELLLEAANSNRRDSGSTISSDMNMENEEEHELSRKLENLELSNLGPRDVIGTYDMSPTDTTFKDDGEGSPHAIPSGDTHNIHGINLDDDYEDSDDDKKLFADIEGHRVKVTIASLEEDGYETSSDSEDGDDDDIHGEPIIKSFKTYTMNGDKSKNNSGNSELSFTKGNKKLKQWPTFKELVNDENTSFISQTIIELFIETGALINDSKLMLQSIHVQELYKKVKWFEAEIMKEVKEDMKVKISGHVKSGDDNDEDDDSTNNNNDKSSINERKTLNKHFSSPNSKKSSIVSNKVMPQELDPLRKSDHSNISLMREKRGLSITSGKRLSNSSAMTKEKSKSKSRSGSTASGSLPGSRSRSRSSSSDIPPKEWLINRGNSIPENSSHFELKQPTNRLKDVETGLRKTRSSISLISTPASFMKNSDTLVNSNNPPTGIDETLSTSNSTSSISIKRGSGSNSESLGMTSTSLGKSTSSVIGFSTVRNKSMEDDLNSSGESKRNSEGKIGLYHSKTEYGILNDDNQSMYSTDTVNTREDSDRSSVIKKKRRNFFSRFRR